MSDILDYIRSKLSTQPLTLETVDAALLDARIEYGGDAAYARRPKARHFVAHRLPAKMRPAIRRRPA